MALSLLFRQPYAKGQVGSVELDVTLREQHRHTSRVTTFPVEDGSILSDHIINEPTIVVLEGIVTDSPLQILPTFNRSVDSFNKLVELHNQRTIVNVITGLKQYPRMAITSLDVPRNLRTGRSLTFTIELQQIELDTTVGFEIEDQTLFGGQQSQISADNVKGGQNIPIIENDPENSLKDQAASGVNFGIQALQEVPPSVLTKIDESLGIILGVT